MRDEHPVVLRRLLALRQFPVFAGADLGDLAVVADNLVEATFPAGARVAGIDSRVPALHLVLDGRIDARTPRETIQSWGPHTVFGLLEVLAGRKFEAPAIAAVETRTLELAASDSIEVLEDNFGVLRTMMRELATRLVAVLEIRPPTPSSQLVVPTGRLTMVERLIVLRQQVPFARGRLQALAALAQASEEVSWPAGSIVARNGSAADGALVILDGTLHATRADHPVRILGPGDAVGSLETLAGLHHRFTVETTTPVRAMRSAGATMLDILEDHTDLGLAMIATFAGALLDASAVIDIGGTAGSSVN
jgi:CRP-like cAMP-binding protein